MPVVFNCVCEWCVVFCVCAPFFSCVFVMNVFVWLLLFVPKEKTFLISSKHCRFLIFYFLFFSIFLFYFLFIKSHDYTFAPIFLSFCLYGCLALSLLLNIFQLFLPNDLNIFWFRYTQHLVCYVCHMDLRSLVNNRKNVCCN